MLLIDALYINEGGGLNLLLYLTEELQQRGIPFVLLGDKRCEDKLSGINQCVVMDASLRKRHHYYKHLSPNIDSVLCFGNIPPSIKLDVPVYTYFHNINLLTLKVYDGIKGKMLYWLKRGIIRYWQIYTDYWIVQTSNTASELKTHFQEPDARVRIYPFYRLPKALLRYQANVERNDYTYVADYYFAARGHDELLDAWTILFKEKGWKHTLHLTVDYRHQAFIKKVEDAVAVGVPVINHGRMSFEDVLTLYGKSKAIVYPSTNESLGLGMIEAVAAGCDVVASDLPFAHEVCQPSVVFNPKSPRSIAEAVLLYESGTVKRTTLRVTNKIDNLISLITAE